MKSKHLLMLSILAILFHPLKSIGQVTLGAAASRFVLYTSSGAVGDNASAHSHVTGDVGTSTSGPITGFGNVDGVMHPGADLATAACNTALAATITQLNASTATLFPSALLGNGVTFIPGVYSIAGNSTLSLNLILDAQNVSTAQFIIKIGGTFGASTNAKVILVNGAKACNVYWQIAGAVSLASLVTMRGNIISGGAITMGSGDSLEGRAFTTAGLIGIDGITAFKPIGCGSPLLTGPPAPNPGSINCYTIFSSIGPLQNTIGTSVVIGDVGKDNDGSSITGWTPAAITGTLHPIRDASTVQCVIDLSKLYDSLNAMVADITLLFPAQFGNNLVLTPHVYQMNSAATFTDSLYLDAQNNPDAIFVIKVAGSMTTSVYAKVKLINGAQSKNVFWVIQGALNINNYSVMRGTFIVPVGAINMVNTGIVLDGRALTMNGAITTAGLTATMSPGCSPTTMIIQPVSKIVCLGSPANFNAKSSQPGATYQWKKGNTVLSNTSNITGVTSDTLKIQSVTYADTSSFYYMVVYGAVTDSSNRVSLGIILPPNINTEPVNAKFCMGDSNYFRVVATGDSLTYQWYKGLIPLKDTLNVSGSKTDSLKIKNLSISDTSSFYSVKVSGTCSPLDSSVFVSLLPQSAPLITVEPASKSVCAGDSTYLIVRATGINLSYQWRRGLLPLTNGLKYSGVGTDSLKIRIISPADTAFNYNVIVTGICSLKDTSLNASLNLFSASILVSQPVNRTVCLGSSVYFSVKATGTGLVYQWRKGLTLLSNSSNISGVGSDTLRIVSAGISDTASNYNVIISSTCSPTLTSINVSLNVNQAPVIVTEPTSKIVCLGNSVYLSVVSQGSGLNYAWRKGAIPMVNGPNVSGAGTDTLKLTSVMIADSSVLYHVIVSGTCSPADTSDFASITVNTPPTVITEPISQTVCIGNAARFIIQETGTGLTYQWRKGNSNLSNNLNISGVTNDTLDIHVVSFSDTSSFYYVVVTGVCSPNDTSLIVSLQANAAPFIVTQPVNQDVCAGNSAYIKVKATGAGLTYQWRKGITVLSNTGNISGADTDSLQISNVSVSDAGSNYHVIVSGTCSPAVTSVFASITVNTPPTVITEPISQTVCIGNAARFIIQETGTGLTYQWRKGNSNLSNNLNISGVTNDTLDIHVVSFSDTSSFYYVVVTGVCSPNDTSLIVSLQANAIPVIVAQPVNQDVCTGSSANFKVKATGAGLTYQWRKGITVLFNTGNISGADTDSLLISNVSVSDTGTNYNVIVTGTCIPVLTSNNVTLTVIPLPVAMAYGTSPVCTGNTIALSTPSIADASYTWSGPNGFGSFLQNPTLASATLNNGGVYTLVVTLNGCNSLPATVNVIVHVCVADLGIVKSVNNMIPLIGRNVTFTLTATNYGKDTAHDVIVSDVLQSGYSFVSATATAGSYDDVTGIWTIGKMDSGGVAVLTLMAKVNASGDYTNSASISGREPDDYLPNNTSTVIPVPTDFNIPEGFSPNGDGINDLFVIRGIDYFPGNAFHIYNRWGNLVFEANPYKNSWDGTSNSGIKLGSDNLPIGTYFYVIDLGDGSPIIKGTIYLNK